MLRNISPKDTEKIEPIFVEMVQLETRGLKTDGERARINFLRSSILQAVQKITGKEPQNMGMVWHGTPEEERQIEAQIITDRLIPFKDFDTDRETFARGQTQMFKGPWSSDFVHGPDAMLFPTQLAAQLLQPEERLAVLRRVSFRKPIQHELDLAVYARSFDKMDSKSPYALDGEFETNKGRTFTFFGIENQHMPVHAEIEDGINRFADAAFCICAECHTTETDGTQHFGLNHDGNNDPEYRITFEMIKEHPAITLATLLEIVALGLANGLDAVEEQDEVNLRLIGGINNLPIPQDLGSVLRSDTRPLQMNLIEDQKRQGRSGMDLLPFQFQFSHQDSPSSGIMATTKSEDLAHRICGIQKG